jgi:hypothetical protein
MAFTAGSPELAKAQRLASILSERYQRFGATNSSGYTGAIKIEKLAKKLGFGITGLTTGAGFPPFGTSGLTTNTQFTVGKLTAVLQNPAGLTQPNGVTVAAFSNGATVGIYLTKFVRSGADSTVTNSSSGAVAGNTFEAFKSGTVVNGGFTATVYFGGAAGSTGTVS